ncbi:putative ABC transport system permease protein [Anaerocolumna jejuensis DSM 15929]|uniref:Putative ABC transport system permease protein n=1 Tax=Anaerocolumna jejuensis DSM 15929 TaxID=1121322 RepID=A0A1M6VNV1_9FIRM|nr:FtsX-like permease family protein [Anaerocolumna jejuensis]SHK82916.1 putative ABC transport system permease protein [Anaerocolumna jejuensis DSM 15929]
MKNNNKKIIRRLSNRSLKNNRMRNIFAVIAIALTALLFTTLFSVGSGMIQVTQEQSMRAIGTSAHAGFKEITKEQYDKLTRHPLIKKSSYDILIGFAKNKELQKRQTEIRYIEPENLDFTFTRLKEGKLPDEENEIVVDTIVMDMLHIPHKIGAKIPLEFGFMGKEYKETFTVSGWYKGDPVIGASQVYLSKAFLNKIEKNYTEKDFVNLKKSQSEDSGVGLIQANVFFSNSRNIEKKVLKVIKDSGYATKEIDYGINWGYLSERSKDIDPVSLFMVLTAFFVMLLTGYLIIYNIFYISIIRDIRFYGLLKTIGATKKQIKSLVRRQAFLLSCIGIPVGLGLGYVVGIGMMPLIFKGMDGLNTANFHLNANPYIFLFGALFSLFTVIISCRKPGKIAGSVSPVEATKYTETSNKKMKTKRTTNGAKISKMALSNLARNKKKTIVVILSMSLSVILLTEVVTFVKSFRLDNYLEEMLTGDFMIGQAALMNTGLSGSLKLDENYYKAVSSEEGIESINQLYCLPGDTAHTLSESGHAQYQKLFSEGKLDVRDFGNNLSEIQKVIKKNSPIAEERFAYDEALLKKLKVIKGSIDLGKFNTGRYILVQVLNDTKSSYYKPGDKVELELHGPESKYVYVRDKKGNIIDSKWENVTKKTYEVMAVVDEIPTSMTLRRFGMNALVTIMPVKELLANCSDAERFAAAFQVQDDKEAALQSFLKNYTEKVDPNTDFESKEGLRGEFSSIINMIGMVGGALSLVISVIGILNFINTMLTSVITRKREFAMLQSIGLTNSQLKRMLVYEGMYYISFTAVISIVIGSLLSVSVVRAFNNVVEYFTYHFTIIPFLSVLPVFVIIAVAVPVISYQSTKKYSIVERLREVE